MKEKGSKISKKHNKVKTNEKGKKKRRQIKERGGEREG